MDVLEAYAIEVTGFFPEDPNQDSFFEEYDDFQLDRKGKLVQGQNENAKKVHGRPIKLMPSESMHSFEDYTDHIQRGNEMNGIENDNKTHGHKKG